MRKGILRLGVVAAAFVTLSAFEDPPLPPEYSPNYSYVDMVGPDGRMKRVLVPDACMTEPEEPSAAGLGEERMLPPGCANAFNLQRMVARKKDLVQGRPIGRAPAATTARAASKYLSGPDANGKKSPSTSYDTQTAPISPQN